MSPRRQNAVLNNALDFLLAVRRASALRLESMQYCSNTTASRIASTVNSVAGLMITRSAWRYICLIIVDLDVHALMCLPDLCKSHRPTRNLASALGVEVARCKAISGSSGVGRAVLLQYCEHNLRKVGAAKRDKA